MSREYRFRGKDNITGKWHYGSLKQSEYGSFIDSPDTITCVDPESVGMFIGKEDVKGNDVYEGDILIGCFELDGEKTEIFILVEWNDELCGFICREKGCIIPSEIDFIEEYEIIGNVYDNPELAEIFKQKNSGGGNNNVCK